MNTDKGVSPAIEELIVLAAAGRAVGAENLRLALTWRYEHSLTFAKALAATGSAVILSLLVPILQPDSHGHVLPLLSWIWVVAAGAVTIGVGGIFFFPSQTTVPQSARGPSIAGAIGGDLNGIDRLYLSCILRCACRTSNVGRRSLPTSPTPGPRPANCLVPGRTLDERTEPRRYRASPTGTGNDLSGLVHRRSICARDRR